MAENGKQPWDRTKWLLLIAILMIIEGFVFYAAMENSNSISALGYISFAGTITSIILAVLAIIYGFVQNGTQDRKSELIAQQMGRVREVVDDLKKSKTDLGDEVEKLESISSGIDRLLLSHNDISSSVSEIKDSLSFVSIAPSNFSGDETNFFKSAASLHVVLYVIYYAIVNKCLEDFETVQDYAVDIFREFSEDDKELLTERYLMLLVGQFSTAILFLSFLEKIKFSDTGKIELDQQFIELLKDVFEQSNEMELNRMREVMKEYDPSNPPS